MLSQIPFDVTKEQQKKFGVKGWQEVEVGYPSMFNQRC